MGQVVKALDKAVNSMDLQKISNIMASLFIILHQLPVSLKTLVFFPMCRRSLKVSLKIWM